MIQQQRQALSRHRILDKNLSALVHGRSPCRIRATTDSHSLCQCKSFINLTSLPWGKFTSALTDAEKRVLKMCAMQADKPEQMVDQRSKKEQGFIGRLNLGCHRGKRHLQKF